MPLSIHSILVTNLCQLDCRLLNSLRQTVEQIRHDIARVDC